MSEIICWIFFNISHFSSTVCTVLQRWQNELNKDSGEERVTAKSRPMMNLTARIAFGRVFFNFIKPGEDLVWISRSLKICCRRRSIGETWEPSPPDYSKEDYDQSWSSQKWSCGARSIRETWENFLGCVAKSCTSSWRTSSRRKCAFRKVRRADSR